LSDLPSLAADRKALVIERETLLASASISPSWV
jgi:hypothetical protein